MGLVPYLVTVLMLSAELMLTSPAIARNSVEGQECKMCPPGEFHKSCTECEPCPAGSFTTDWNLEDSCHRCFGDCRPDYHLKVVQNCTSLSDIKCVCEDGFHCTDMVQYSDNCRFCGKIVETPQTVATAVTSRNDKEMPSSVSRGHTSTSAKPCRSSECMKSVPSTPSADVMNRQLAAILCPVAIMGCVALTILFCFCCPGDETCFKQAIAKFCHDGRKDASHKSSHQFPRDSFSAKQQPPYLSAANPGPVHVHSAGTVIFSWFNQFTGQVSPTFEGGNTIETVRSEEEEDERDCHVCQPTSSLSVHLSEEERSREIDSVFFPSQEQGKDCHVSKEEEL